jgi:hypothetical protein
VLRTTSDFIDAPSRASGEHAQVVFVRTVPQFMVVYMAPSDLLHPSPFHYLHLRKKHFTVTITPIFKHADTMSEARPSSQRRDSPLSHGNGLHEVGDTFSRLRGVLDSANNTIKADEDTQEELQEGMRSLKAILPHENDGQMQVRIRNGDEVRIQFVHSPSLQQSC